jgi:poly-gamma-glutamate capsule biosynthesis protein CapA/YwtB (metallophosphatase superfamily)
MRVAVLAAAVVVAAVAATGARPGLTAPAARLTVVAGGDIMPVQAVAAVVDREGADSLFAHVGDPLRAADIAFANLEAPLTRRGAPSRGKEPEDLESGRDYLFRGSPAVAGALGRAGFDVVSLANNHAMDYGAVGLMDTIAVLTRAGVRAVGAGPTLDEARRPVIIERRGVRVAVLAYSDVIPRLSVATAAAPGVAPARGLWSTRSAEDEIADGIRSARGHADNVIVSVHWGTESQTMPDCRQITLGRRMLDAGATVVLGHHPHVLQPVVSRDRRLLAYSLGNLVASPRGQLARETALLTITLDRRGVAAWGAAPLLVHDGRPRPAPQRVASAVRARLAASTAAAAERCRRAR